MARLLISLRYRIKIKGRKEVLKALKGKKGVVFLPNHPALMDPVILSVFLYSKFKMRPLVVEYVYRQPFINKIMKMINALPIPNFSTSMSDLKKDEAEKAMKQMEEGLKNGENFIFYPAGRLKYTGKEIVGGASATHTILQNVPEAQVVLIRTTGLWGSSFSRAETGKSPDFKGVLVRNIKYLLMNVLFFVPKRKVIVEMESVGEDFPRNGTRLELNRYLENWYNQYPVDGKRVNEEPLKLVSYLFYKKKCLTPKISSKDRKEQQIREFSSEIEKEVVQELAKLANMSTDQIQQEMDLSADLGLDSLDIAELITFLNIHFETKEIHPEDLIYVSDALEIAEGKKESTQTDEEKSSFTWPSESGRNTPKIFLSNTVTESLIRSMKRGKNLPALGDDMLGVLSYKKFLLAALVLSQKIKNFEGKHIGIMLPSSGAACLLIFATLLAKKVPVMLNWTLGPRYLNHMVSLTNTKVVISSFKFLEKAQNLQLGDVKKQIVFLEDIKKEVSFLQKIKGLMLSKKTTCSLVRSLKLKTIKSSDPVVVLFTSGTEAAPKGVPLSHKNILENLTAALSMIGLYKTDIFYGILPPFHSFGFTVSGLFPLLAGIRVAYYPDPTDSYALVEGINRWKVTFFCSAPSFLKSIFAIGKKDKLSSLRLVVTGAEKASKALYEKVEGLGNTKLLEGYGVTECAPVLTFTPPEAESRGVGKLLPGVEVCTIHPETHKLLEEGKEGELCFRGPNIFSGYLGDQKSPFIEINGSQWYMTGDLGYLDPDGYIILSGRLKRFAKIGGEMVSLSAIEHILIDHLSENADVEGHLLAVVAKEIHEGKTLLILFSVIPMDKSDVNRILHEAGMSRLVKIAEIHHLDEIPILGTGKIDYRYLQNMAN